jgi:putative FmdB family regulatory protein
MPTYEYECQACGHAFEELQSMTDAKLTKCPKCHKKKLARLISSGSGMIFKGSGFYETDYKKKTVPAGDKKDSPQPAAKPASTPSTKPAASCGGGCACHPQ